MITSVLVKNCGECSIFCVVEDLVEALPRAARFLWPGGCCLRGGTGRGWLGCFPFRGSLGDVGNADFCGRAVDVRKD